MSITVKIIDGPLGPADAWYVNGAGAVVTFDGVVRPMENDKAISGLDYEVYSPMAERELVKLAQQVMERHGVVAVDVMHSRGFVPNFAVSFRLRIASSHRAAALAAMGEFIDRMKQDVPIWKKAVYAER